MSIVVQAPTLQALRAALMGYPKALAALWAIPDRAAFAEKVAEMGRGAGVEMGPDAVLAALTPRGPTTPAMPILAGRLSPEWLPSRFTFTPQGGRVEWVYTGGLPFTAPFADQDIARLETHPLNQLLPAISNPGELSSLPGPAQLIDGMIFHIGRSGSTLASRMLAQVPEILVLSEPQPLAAVLGLHSQINIDPKVQQAWLNGILGAYRRAAMIRRLVIKLDVDSLFDHARLRILCPDTPFVVMHRDPLEVLSAQAASGQPNLPPPPEIARWLAALCLTGAKAVEAGARPIAYADLPAAVLEPGFLKLYLGDEDRAKMASVAGMDAKSPAKPFVPDGPARQAAADERLRMLDKQVVRPAWEKLAMLG